MNIAKITLKMLAALPIVAMAFLAYAAGAWTVFTESFPFDPYIRQAFVGFKAAWLQHVAEKDPLASDVLMRADGGATGVVTYVPDRAYAGYTLMAAGQRALLVDMDGAIVHEWSLPYRTFRATAPADDPDLPESWIYWRPVKLFANGDLIAIVDAWATTPEGLAMIKIDRQSQLIWAYHHPVHHDFDVDKAGSIYLLDQRIRNDPPSGLSTLRRPFLGEGIVILSPDGRRIDRVSIVDAFARSEYAEMVNHLAREDPNRLGDYLHNNNVDLVTPELAAAFPFLEAGQVLLSMRELDTIAALDLESERIVWAMRGPWHKQHDPDLLENGHILLFDNQGDWDRGAHSRVIELDPRTSEIVWSYPQSEAGALWSAYRGEQQALPNGNVLINEFLRGRLLEVDRDGDIVWEFVTPFEDQDNPAYVARIMSAERYPRDWIAFEPTGAAAAKE